MTQVCWDVDPHLDLENETHASQETIQEVSETQKSEQEGHQPETSDDLSFSLPPSSIVSEEDMISPRFQEVETGDSPEKSGSNSSSETWIDKTFWSNIDIESLGTSPKTP